jgi:hypothetical protein
MNDRRVAAMRSALEALIESIDATTRIARWDSSDPIPASLGQSAAKLETNLASAKKLAQGNISGTPAVTAHLMTMTAAIRRLCLACEQFQTRCSEHPEEKVEALQALDFEVDEVKS